MKVMLTGATGFLGSEIARQLVAAGHRLRVLVRKTSKLDGLRGLDIEKVEGDILDRDSVLGALDGCEAVIHTAAAVAFRRRDRETLYRSNVEGTKTVLGAALEKKVKRAVYTSSIAAVGATVEPRLLDETSTWDLEAYELHYVTAKKRAEEEALELARKGLPLVVLNPGSILGPGDLYLSSTKLIHEWAKGRMRVHTGGGASFCDVREVARAHVDALERGRVGERYILAGLNKSYGELYQLASRIAGLEATRRAPYAIAWVAARISELVARVRPHSFEELNVPIVRFGQLFSYMDASKARNELGYTVRPFEETLRDTIADHVRRGLYPASTPELRALEGAAAPAPAAAPALATAAA